MIPDHVTCRECSTYATVRMPLVFRHTAQRVKDNGSLLSRFYDRYMGGVHQRHLAGLPILPGSAA